MFGFLKPDPAREAARNLLAAISEAARAPSLFGDGRAPDTFDGRFQVVTLLAALAMRRLKREPGAGRLAQMFADQLFRSFDEGLREAGIGDLSVAKHMKKLAGAFYGRLSAYDSALGGDLAEGERSARLAALAAALSRNIWNEESIPFAASLAEGVSGLAEKLESAPLEALGDLETWGINLS
jgi:cytochrome b pre-mRNA-processing protein 3